MNTNQPAGNFNRTWDAGQSDATAEAFAVRTSRVQNAVKALLLLSLGLFLYSRLAGGTLVFYINERFFGYTLFAFLGLLAVGLSYPIIRRKGAETGAPGPEAQLKEIDYQYHDLAPHDHTRDHRITLAGALVVALPILLGILVPPRPLGAAALESRELNLDLRASSTNLPAAIAAARANEGPRNIMEWWHTFQATPDLSTLEGSEVQIEGFVYHDSRYGEDYFLATRFVVSCCTADAAAVALLVHWPQAAALETDQWVEVRGTLTSAPENVNLEGWRPPVVSAETLTPIDIPSHPYLYP